MNKYKVTIQPVPPASAEDFLVAGFDEKDAKKQGMWRWKMENEDRYLNDIVNVLVEPWPPEGVAT